MNVFDVFARLLLDTSGYEKSLSDATQETSVFGGVLKANLLSTAVTKGIEVLGQGIKKVADGFVDLTKQSFDAYGEYEQLVGGIETLFGTGGAKTIEEYAQSVGKSVDEIRGEYEDLSFAQDLMMLQAQDAYKTAGMSVNEYMNTATSFAAALTKSVKEAGGSMSEAAEYADLAMTDMADNANKMGTDMASIQNAYQGFAKQNYTMLDNLKLGYGGTKEGMEQLIADANRLREEQGLTGDLTIESFADIVTAIHEVQDNLGITGTTAKEASKTVQGSIKSVKAAWQNLVTGFGDPNADLGLLIQNVVDAGITALDNIVPAIGRILTGIGEAIDRVAPIVTQKLPELASTLLPPLIKAVSSLIKGIVKVLPSLIQVLIQAAFDLLTEILNALPEIIATLAEAIPKIVTTLITALMDNLPAIIQGLIGIVVAIVQAIPTIIVGLIEALPTIITSIIMGLIESLPILIQGLVDLVLAIVEALPQIIMALIEAIPKIIEMVSTTVKENGLPILQAVGSHLLEILQTIGTWFVGLLSSLGTWLAGIWQSVVTWFSNLISSIASWFVSIGQSIASFFVGIWNSVTGWLANLWQSVVGFFSNIISGIVGFVSNIISTVANFFVNIWNSVTSWLSNLLSNIWNFIIQIPQKIAQGLSNIGTIGKNMVIGLWNGIAGAAQWLWDKVTGWVGSIWSGIKSFFGIHSPSTQFAWIGEMLDKGLAEGIDKYAGVAVDSAMALSEGVNDAVDVGGDLAVSSAGEGNVGGASVVINVYGAVGQDVDELAILISEKIQRMINRNGAVYA